MRDGMAAIDRHFPAGMGAGALAVAAWGVSCVSLAAALAFYVALVPGFGANLMGGGAALWYLMRQVVLNGLPVVFAINLAGFALYARVARGRGRPGTALALDALLRAALFIGLHLAIYPLSARLLGSFGGDPGQALAAVGPTLAAAAGFGNLSGVYLYATAASAYPLLAALLAARTGERRTGWLVAAFLPYFVLLATAISGFAALLASVEAGPALG